MKMTEHNLSSIQYDQGLEVNHQYEGPRQPDHSGLQYKDPIAYAPAPPSGGGPKRPQNASARGNPCGLGPLAFGLLIALVTSIVVGAAVGGGISSHSSRYGSFAFKCSSNRNTRPEATTVSISPQSTTTVTVTETAYPTSTPNISYAAALPQDVVTVKWDCPSITSYTTSNLQTNQVFAVTCGVDYYNNIAAIQGGIVADIVGIVAYSAADCMEACANMNIFASQWGFSTKCAGITFGEQMSIEYSNHGANCFLKNGTSVNPLSSDEALSASVVT